MMGVTLLDTDILSEILKQQNKSINAIARAYLTQHKQFTFSAFTQYEVRRGLIHRGAAHQLQKFQEFTAHSTVLGVDEAVFEAASELWVLGRQSGQPCSDADLLIAATAIANRLILATGNVRHFAWMPGLRLSDWRSGSGGAVTL